MTQTQWTARHGEALRQRRHRRGLTQEALAEAAGVGVSTIKNVERGVRQPRTSTLQLLAEALGCAAQVLQDGQRLPSVAVLPFLNLSADPEQDYFCEGLAEELINALVQVQGLSVAARTSSFHFKDRREDLRAIGDALGVETVLEGSLRLGDGRLRITAQLIRVEDGFHLWSEQLDRRLGEALAVQTEIAQVVVDRLRVDLAAGEREQLVKRHVVDNEAHHLYLKGLYFWHRRFEGGLNDALTYFQRALDRDPVHAPAHVGIAGCYIALGVHTWRPPHEVMPKARLAVERALEIDDTLADAHAARAALTFHYDWNWPLAEQQFRRAIALNPRSAITRAWYAGALGNMERIDDALVEAEHAQELDPLSPFVGWLAGSMIFLARRHEEALERFHAILDLEPRFVLATLSVGSVHIAMGNYEQAASTYESVVETTANGWDVALGCLGYAYGLAGRRDRAIAIRDRMQELSRKRWVSPDSMSLVHDGLGDGDKALDMVAVACQQREPLLLATRASPACDPIRDKPWFRKAEEMIGMWD